MSPVKEDSGFFFNKTLLIEFKNKSTSKQPLQECIHGSLRELVADPTGSVEQTSGDCNREIYQVEIVEQVSFGKMGLVFFPGRGQ